MLNLNRLKDLNKELDKTYRQMNEILQKNSLAKRQKMLLPHEDYLKYQELNAKSINLISEFSDILKSSL